MRKERLATWDGGNITWGGRVGVLGTVPVCVCAQEGLGVLTLNLLEPVHIYAILRRASDDRDKGLVCSSGFLPKEIEVSDEVVEYLSQHCDGDALVALNAFEISSITTTTRLGKDVGMTDPLAILQAATKDVKDSVGKNKGVPLHLRNAPTKLMKDLGVGFVSFQPWRAYPDFIFDPYTIISYYVDGVLYQVFAYPYGGTGMVFLLPWLTYGNDDAIAFVRILFCSYNKML
nr:ATPase WRNIP1 [Tanacetum cinerariifolium]